MTTPKTRATRKTKKKTLVSKVKALFAKVYNFVAEGLKNHDSLLIGIIIGLVIGILLF